MRFRSFDSLRVFSVVARCLSVTDAARELSLSKASVSYQIRKLEDQLGFCLFERQRQRIHLTSKGEALLNSTQLYLDQLDRDIRQLQERDTDLITIGVLTYFFSRWLSSRLMDFMQQHPDIAIRVEPITDVADLAKSGVDVAICWGVGDVEGFAKTLLFRCPARPTANSDIARRVREIGLKQALKEIPLLSDSSGSTGWQEWHQNAGYEFQPTQNRLIIPDSNDRVQAVIDGQGIALWDDLVRSELESGELCYLSDIAIEEAGYFLLYLANQNQRSTVIQKFSDWICDQQ